ncbi:MAG: cache domain-containing protein [Elusimicrobia bacterium]|nr:cache domain-containing protein [Elusimicrobiota bacterium]
MRRHLVRRGKSVLCLLCAIAFSPGQAAARADPRHLNRYIYEDTRRLVALVEDAADLLEREGSGAFAELGRKGSRWFDDERYFFVYDRDGNCVFHAQEPHLVGENLMDLKDMDGKPVIRMITDVARQPGDRASGWVFYLWEDRVQMSPSAKGAYVRKVNGPDGKVYAIGSGLYNLKMEKEFVRERVTMAAELLRTKGKDRAFAEFRDPGAPFAFLDTFIFVMRMDGRSLLDPAILVHAGRDLSGFQDAMGRYVVREMLEKLAQGEEAWVQYLWPKPGASLPSRKVAYVRKVRVGGEDLVVGADFFMATPIWMRL